MSTEPHFVRLLNNCLHALTIEAGPHPVGVIQIGAADGRTGDYLHHFLTTSACCALLLEPVTHVFQELCMTYQNYPSVECRQQAVSDVAGTRSLYRIRDVTGLPWWADQLASFDHQVILSHAALIPNLAAQIISEPTTTVTPSMLIAGFARNGIDIVATDTEGHDDIILAAFLCAECFPRLILFEHKHLSSARFEVLSARLRECGYELFQGVSDTLCARHGFSSFHVPRDPLDT